jgi:protein required for attachment to host cells
MTVRIVVADQSAARFYDVERIGAPLRFFDELSDAKARLHDRDFKSDRPGRVFDHAPPATGRRGSVAHHATGGERSPRKHETQLFARRIAAVLQAAQRDGQFQALVLMAAPAFLGALRAALPKTLSTVITAEVPKDLVHEAESAVVMHLSPSAFPSTVEPRD